MMKLTHKTLEAIAFHEAGHAVQAIVEGARIRRATIIPDGRTAGHVLHTMWRLERDGVVIAAAAEKHGRTILAGSAATRLHRSRLVQRDQMLSDRLAALNYAEKIARSERERDAILRLWSVQAEDSMERNWHRVQAVAHALVERKTLTHAEVQEVFDSAQQQWLNDRLRPWHRLDCNRCPAPHVACGG